MIGTETRLLTEIRDNTGKGIDRRGKKNTVACVWHRDVVELEALGAVEAWHHGFRVAGSVALQRPGPVGNGSAP